MCLDKTAMAVPSRREYVPTKWRPRWKCVKPDGKGGTDQRFGKSRNGIFTARGETVTYPVGFHVFVGEEEAEAWRKSYGGYYSCKPRQVWVKDLLAVGMQSGSTIVSTVEVYNKLRLTKP